MSATLERMPRNKKPATPNVSAEPKTAATTDVIRVDADLAYKLGVIVAIKGGSVAQLVSPALRPLIETWYADALAEAESKKS